MTTSNRLPWNNSNLFFLLDYPFMFPEDAEIRIPPEPAKSCPPKLEVNYFLTKKNIYFYFYRKNLKNIINVLKEQVLIKMH